jgi:hypothetical protein
MRPTLYFRLNGICMPELRLERALIHGEPVGELQIAIRDAVIGWLTLCDADLSPSAFILEYRRTTDTQNGWRIILSCRHMLKVLTLNGCLDEETR